MTKQLLILVDKNDNEVGALEKMLVHQKGLLHRAFSIFIFNSENELLLQQRADDKYHSPGLWTNTCCSHPYKDEKMEDAINRRLQEEMGMQCDMAFAFSFIYKVQFDNGLTEHEYDHVYIGETDKPPTPNSTEVKNWKYLSLKKLETDITINAGNYTEWLKICLPELIKHVEKQSGF